jgi:hypothetical protein
LTGGNRRRGIELPELNIIGIVKNADLVGRRGKAILISVRYASTEQVAASEPRALTKLGLDNNHWTMRIKGIGSGYWRIVGEVEDLVDKA